MGLMSLISDALNTYETKRVFKIKRKRVSLLNNLTRLLILFVIGGIICFQYFIFGQLRRVAVISSTLTTKVKGLGYNNQTIDGLNETIFDVADYIIPPDENNAIFIMTNYMNTEQKRGACDEDPSNTDAICQNDSDCFNRDFTRWNGKPTGFCINSTRNTTLKVCQLKAWCPVESDVNSNRNVIENVLNFTIFVKSTVEFKEFEKIERNILPYMTNNYITNCNRNNDSYCPIFQVGDMLKEAEPNEKNRQDILTKGGVLQFSITWDCDYSPHITDQCLPVYKIVRFDGEPQLGFNFRYADKFSQNGTAYRNLNKVYGLRIIIETTGKGKKPDAIGIITAFLAFVTLFSFSVIITDYYILKLYATEEERKQLTNILVATESKETSSQISASANKYREIEKPVIENL